MTYETVDIHTDQNTDYGKVTGRFRNQKRDNGENSRQETVKEDQNCSVKMRRTRSMQEKVSCYTCHTLFTKKTHLAAILFNKMSAKASSWE